MNKIKRVFFSQHSKNDFTINITGGLLHQQIEEEKPKRTSRVRQQRKVSIFSKVCVIKEELVNLGTDG